MADNSRTRLDVFAKLFLGVVLIAFVTGFHANIFYYLTVYSMWYAVGLVPENYGVIWTLILRDVIFYSGCLVYVALGAVLFFWHHLFSRFLWLNLIAGLGFGLVTNYFYLESFDWDRIGVFVLFLILVLLTESFRKKQIPEHR